MNFYHCVIRDLSSGSTNVDIHQSTWSGLPAMPFNFLDFSFFSLFASILWFLVLALSVSLFSRKIPCVKLCPTYVLNSGNKFTL